MTPKNKMAAQYVNITAIMKHFLVVFAASLVLTRIESKDIRGVNYPHEITFLHDYTLYREHDILFTSPTLLPLVNVPLIDYTLEFLAAAGIQQTIVFCSAHSQQIIEYLQNSQWCRASSLMEIIIETSDTCISVGDALRDIESKQLIEADFILVNGDIVSNVKLKQILDEHKIRRFREKTPIMTLVMKEVPPGHRSRCREDQVVLAVENKGDRVLSYRPVSEAVIDFDLEIFSDRSQVDIRYDLADTTITICSPLVPKLFTDEFDYQTRGDFIRGILDNEEILGNTIHMHLIEEEYACRVSNLHMYDAVSQDMMSRWVHPVVPENNIGGRVISGHYSHNRHNVYLHSDVSLARGCEMKENVMVGEGTSIGSDVCIEHCVIGNNCVIGDNVRLESAYILDNVQISNGCVVLRSLLDEGVQLKSNVTVQQGCVISRKVIVGPDVTLGRDSRLCDALPDDDGFRDETSEPAQVDSAIVGLSGHGYLFKTDQDESVGSEDDKAATDAWGLLSSSSEEDSISGGSSSEDDEDEMGDESKVFYEELMSTLERAMCERLTENLVFEVNSLKAAYAVQIKEVNQRVTKGILEYPLHMSPSLEPSKYLTQLKKNLEDLAVLLKNYIRSEESQMDCLVALEDVCLTNSTISTVMMKILHHLYEMEVISEDVVITWYNSSAVSQAEDLAARKTLREKVLPFIEWLEDAEEESESDE